MATTHFSTAIVLGLLVAGPALAQDVPRVMVTNAAAGVPVFAGDLTDHRYVVLGTVKVGVRKATIFSRKASEAKIYHELWERARRMGADAVINADYGNSHVTAVSWGKTNATGTAIKFVDAATTVR